MDPRPTDQPPRRQAPRRAARLPALLLLGSALTGTLGGCSYIPWIGGEKDPTPPTKLADLVPAATLSPLWSVRPTVGSEGRRLGLVPAVGGGRVYVADARGRVVALDSGTGRVLWERETGLGFSAGPDLSGDKLLLGTTGGEALMLAAADGREVWRSQLDSEVLSVPRASGEGKVIVHSLDDTVYGLDAGTGKELWRFGYPPPVLTLRGSSSPTLVPGGVAVGLSGGRLVKLDLADGAPLWDVLVTPPSGRSELARISDIDADPIPVGNLLFVGTYNGDLAAVDLASGAVQWRRELSSYAGLAATETELYVTDSEDLIWGADPVSGAGRWKQEALRFRRLTAPTPIGNLIAVGDLEGWIHLIAQSDGRLMGRIRLSGKGAITARPVAAGGRLYVYSNDGTVSALSLGGTPAGRPAPEQGEGG
jgi:outer membrane protein assembly factor BamB